MPPPRVPHSQSSHCSLPCFVLFFFLTKQCVRGARQAGQDAFSSLPGVTVFSPAVSLRVAQPQASVQLVVQH